MNHKQRIDNFEGEDSEYLLYLESKVTTLQTQLQLFGAQPFPLNSEHSPPSPPRSATHTDAPDVEFAFFSYGGPDPQEPRPAKKPRPEKSRWQIEMDKMLDGVPVADDWESRRHELNLCCGNDLQLAFDIILGDVQRTEEKVPRELEYLSASDLSSTAETPIVKFARLYAGQTKTLQAKFRFTTQILRFRELVFVSLCLVMINNGIEQDVVDAIMRICISNSDSKHLERLRIGALWVNRMMAELESDGLGHRAAELFVLCGQSIAKYARFAEATDQSFPYFKNSIQDRGYPKPPSEIHKLLPFSVPFFIQTIVGDLLRLSDISVALHYAKDHIATQYDAFLQTYRDRRLRHKFCALCLGTASDRERLHQAAHQNSYPLPLNNRLSNGQPSTPMELLTQAAACSSQLKEGEANVTTASREVDHGGNGITNLENGASFDHDRSGTMLSQPAYISALVNQNGLGGNRDLGVDSHAVGSSSWTMNSTPPGSYDLTMLASLNESFDPFSSLNGPFDHPNSYDLMAFTNNDEPLDWF